MQINSPIWNISNISLNIVFYVVLCHFLLLLVAYGLIERREIRDSSYRFFVFGVASLALDNGFLTLFLYCYGRVSAILLNLITFCIITSYSFWNLCTLIWFFSNLDDRRLPYRKGLKNLAMGILFASLITNFLYFFQKDYYIQVFGSNYFSAPNFLSFIYSVAISSIALVYMIHYRKEVPLAPILCITFFLIAPQVLFLSNLKLHAAVSMYIVLLSYIVHHRYWVIHRRNLEREENHARMRNLVIMRQIRPHFVFNCLSSIEALCERDPQKAQTALVDLSMLLRNTMDDLGTEHTKPFPEILDMVGYYIRLEQMRFGKLLQVEYDIQYTDFSMPSLILQPIVENAIKHGLINKEHGGMIKISSSKQNNEILISVEDNGMGMDVHDYSHEIDLDGRSHIGLSNVEQRLKLLCSGTMDIESELGRGTRVTLHIPGEVLQ